MADRSLLRFLIETFVLRPARFGFPDRGALAQVSSIRQDNRRKGSPMRRIYILILLSPLLTTASVAQGPLFGNPTLKLMIQHPPLLGLKVTKIAFGPASGECADQIVEALISDFVSNQVEVVDRQHLDAVLAEHHLTISGSVDQKSAAAIGKLLGPSALIFVKTQRCATQQDRLYATETRHDRQTDKDYQVRVYYARTRAFLKVSIQTVDLATGRIFAARTLDFSPEQSNESVEGYPEAPAEFDVLDMAIQSAVTDVHQMFLPWSEETSLIYYDDKDCGLKHAYALVKAGDLSGALLRSQENLEACKNIPNVKPKLLGHAYYNLGMNYAMRSEYDMALANFREAAKLIPGGTVTKAITDTEKAKELALAMQQIDDRASVASGQEQTAGEKAAAAEAAATLTNADIIQMTRSKLPTSIIIQKIKTSKHKFDTSADGLVKLNQAGVSEQVIVAMMEP